MTDLTFEDCLSRLEEVVAQLESGKLSLEASLKAFEEGIALARTCARYLDDAERRLEVLTRNQAGELGTQPLILGPDADR